MIEWRNCRDRIKWFALGEYLALLAMRCQVTGENLPIVINAELTGKAVNVKGSTDFVEAVFFAQTTFSGNQVGNFFLTLNNLMRNIS